MRAMRTPHVPAPRPAPGSTRAQDCRSRRPAVRHPSRPPAVPGRTAKTDAGAERLVRPAEGALLDGQREELDRGAGQKSWAEGLKMSGRVEGSGGMKGRHWLLILGLTNSKGTGPGRRDGRYAGEAGEVTNRAGNPDRTKGTGYRRIIAHNISGGLE